MGCVAKLKLKHTRRHSGCRAASAAALRAGENSLDRLIAAPKVFASSGQGRLQDGGSTSPLVSVSAQIAVLPQQNQHGLPHTLFVPWAHCFATKATPKWPTSHIVYDLAHRLATKATPTWSTSRLSSDLAHIGLRPGQRHDWATSHCFATTATPTWSTSRLVCDLGA